ncbi:hypothetical protein LNTAR_13017 [Lentisphaera araneosa HTCC2155]|uniref:Uncharacterized protein n=1 Tax=Lentisphaera araneosa HTCC2155 TaxID=313628 RepID=A6DRK2_9BACT|nr:hypothetical protein LNTAR_13017 [Lentisphaera araneosa HTCC2155]
MINNIIEFNKKYQFRIILVLALALKLTDNYPILDFIVFLLCSLFVITVVITNVTSYIKWIKVKNDAQIIIEEGFGIDYINDEIKKIENNNTLSDNKKTEIINKMKNAIDSLNQTQKN